MRAGSESRRLPHSELYPAGVEGVAARVVALSSGLRVRVVEAGDSGAPPVVLIPGWGCSAWIFHETMLPLAASGFRAIAVELKGHGRSDKPLDPAEYTVGSMRRHVIDILDALEVERAGIVGHSMGGAIAAHVSAAVPGRVSGLVLAAPVGFGGVRGMGVFRTLTPEFAVPAFRFVATRQVIWLMLKTVYGSLTSPTERDVEEFYTQADSPAFVSALRHLLHEFEWDAEFPEIKMPSLVIAGSEDILSPASEASRYGDRTVVIEKAGHVLFSEAPARVNRELSEFFSGVAGPYISGTNA